MSRKFEAAALRAKDDYRRDVMLAWNISRVFFTSRGKKRLVDPKDLLRDVNDGHKEDIPVAELTPAQMMAAAQSYATLLGTKLRRVVN